MSLLTIFRIALSALNRNMLRTTLTTLGMIIGVAAVITMVALGRGAQQSIEDQIRSAGTNMIMVMAGNWTVGGVRQGQGASNTLTPVDAMAVRDVPGVQYVAPGVNTRAQVISGNQNWQTRIEGTDVDMPLIRSWMVRHGAFFTAQDVSSAAKVAVLGTVAADALFGENADPTGQVIRVRNQPFRVVGVMTSKGQSAMGQDQDDIVFVPYTTVQKKLLGIQHIQNVTVSAVSAAAITPTADAIAELLRSRHKIQPGEPDDFMVRTLEEMASVRTEATRTMTALLAGIAGVSLVVGGIGIMNIMLVSVTERTREIGLRLAVGARGRAEWVREVGVQRSPDPRGGVARDEVDLRLLLVVVEAAVDGVYVALHLIELKFRTVRESRVESVFESGCGRLEIDRIDRRERFAPDLGVLLAGDQVLKVVLRDSDGVERFVNGLLEIRHLRFRGGDVDRGELPLLNEAFVVLVLALGVLDGVALHLQIAQGECEVPVGPLHVRDRFDRALAELSVGEREIPLRYLDRAAVLVEAAAAEERLRDARRDVRIELRADDRDRVVGCEARVVRGDV
jgi:putative ABC transport system permease protein